MKKTQNRLIAVVASVTTGFILTLPSCLTAGPLDSWNVRNPVNPIIPQDYYRGIAFGNGIFVAYGAAGSLVTSSNGLSWKAVPSNPPYWGGGSGLSYCNGRFILGHGSGRGASSINGTNWNDLGWVANASATGFA